MIRFPISTACFLALASTGFAAPAAFAQDMPVLDPSAYSRPMVMHSAINAQARKRGKQARQPSTRSDSARTCARRPQLLAQYGEDDPRYQNLDRLCRKAGL